METRLFIHLTLLKNYSTAASSWQIFKRLLNLWLRMVRKNFDYLHAIVHFLTIGTDLLILQPGFHEIQREDASHPYYSGYSSVYDFRQKSEMKRVIGFTWNSVKYVWLTKNSVASLTLQPYVQFFLKKINEYMRFES